MFKVKVVKATNLVAADIGGKSDPYAKLKFERKPAMKAATKSGKKAKKTKVKTGKTGKVVHQTVTVKKTLNPTWNQTFDFSEMGPITPDMILTITVWDWDKYGEHDFLGSAHIDMSGLVQGQEKLGTYKLMGKKKGDIQVGIVPINFNTPPVNGYEGNIQANQKIAASNALKSSKQVKNAKASKNFKAVGKGLLKMF